MPASDANEPYAAIMTRLAAQSSLVSALTGGYRRGGGADNKGFPQLIFKTLGQGVGGTDAEKTLYRDERLQFTLYGYDQEVLTDLALLVDSAFNDAVLGGVMTCTNWRITLLSRVSPWQEIEDTDRQGTTGNSLWLLASDWRMKALRKQ